VNGAAQLDIFARARLLQLMWALEQMGGTPIETFDLHAFAYLSNVLSPLWDIEPLEASILKDRTKSGPYYPSLQRALEECVGSGLIDVVELHSMEDLEVNSLRATFRLAAKRASSLLSTLGSLPDERQTSTFLVELAGAFLDIRDDRRDDAAAMDAAYSDPAVAKDRVVDFGLVKERESNPSWNAAQTLQRYAPVGVTLNRAEKLIMYVRLLQRWAQG
jgi:hypothetical protein